MCASVAPAGPDGADRPHKNQPGHMKPFSPVRTKHGNDIKKEQPGAPPEGIFDLLAAAQKNDVYAMSRCSALAFQFARLPLALPFDLRIPSSNRATRIPLTN